MRIGDSARGELRRAASYYDEQMVGLGDRFLAELDELLAQVALFPNAGLLIREGLRQRLLPTFPYLVIYSTDWPDPEVLVVAHTSRRNEYWIERWEVREIEASYLMLAA